MAPLAASAQADSTRAGYRTALITVRDSLIPLRGAMQTLRRDLATAAPVTVEAKALRLAAACRGAVATLERETPVFRSAGESGAALQRAMRTLHAAITTHCLRGLDPDGPGAVADTLRRWAPYRTAQLRDAEGAYHGAAARFARVHGINIPPLNPGGN